MKYRTIMPPLRFEWAAHLGPRDILRCTSCGSLVLGNLTGTYDPADSDELLHARWHAEQERGIGDTGLARDLRNAPGRSRWTLTTRSKAVP